MNKHFNFQVDLSPSPNHVQHNTGIKVPRQHIISPDAIKICKELGSGEFGVVEQGVLNDGNRTHQVCFTQLCFVLCWDIVEVYDLMKNIFRLISL
jgi:hypothetical protein